MSNEYGPPPIREIESLAKTGSHVEKALWPPYSQVVASGAALSDWHDRLINRYDVSGDDRDPLRLLMSSIPRPLLTDIHFYRLPAGQRKVIDGLRDLGNRADRVGELYELTATPEEIAQMGWDGARKLVHARVAGGLAARFGLAKLIHEHYLTEAITKKHSFSTNYWNTFGHAADVVDWVVENEKEDLGGVAGALANLLQKPKRLEILGLF